MKTHSRRLRCAGRFLAAVGVCLIGLTSVVTARAAARRPNVVFVLIDDLGWRDVGCFGSTLYETPHIDRLAAGGMKFTNAYAACPVCSPTRASIMCGKYPARIRLTNFLKGRRNLKGSPILSADYADQMDLQEVTIAEVLKSHGYRTGFIGKWHLGGPAMVETVDDSVGRVLQTLRRLKIEDETIVIFFSDNGGLATPEGPHTPSTTNAPLRAGKGFLYEGGIREPLIVRWPGVVKPGSVSDEPVVSIDFLPTICDMVGISFSGVKINGRIDGISVASVLKDPDSHLPNRAIYWHYPHFSNQGGRPGAAVRVGNWKLIERYEFGRLELYDLKNDVGERKNLAKRFPDRADRMRSMLVRWRQSVRANMPKPNPAYEP